MPEATTIPCRLMCPMQQRTIDQTDLQVSQIALGTGSLHHLSSSAARQALLLAAFDAGITHFDTSCFDGSYVTGDISDDYLAAVEARRRDDVKQARELNSLDSTEVASFS